MTALYQYISLYIINIYYMYKHIYININILGYFLHSTYNLIWFLCISSRSAIFIPHGITYMLDVDSLTGTTTIPVG